MKVYTDAYGNTLHVDMHRKVIFAKNAKGKKVVRSDVLHMVRLATDTHKTSGKVKMDGHTFTLRYLKGKKKG
jgi:hypothetical protein